MRKIKIKTWVLFLITVLCFVIPVQVSAAAKISNTSITLIKGQKKTLKVSGTKKKVKWSSSKKSVATVSTKGIVKAKKKGTATITAKVGGKSYKCKVKVETPSISKKSVNITVGKTYSLKMNGTSQKVTWKSSKTSVATVSNGKVTAKKVGTTKITATVLGKKYTCKVTVKSSDANTSTSAGTVTYYSEGTDYGAVIIAKNTYSYTVEVRFKCVYYNESGTMVDTSTCVNYALGAGRECALQAWTTSDYSTFNIVATVEKASDIVSNVDNIYVGTSNFTSDGGVIAYVKNTGSTNEYTQVAVVYYANGVIVGYDYTYAEVKSVGAEDYVEFSHPYDKNYDDITATSYKIFVNNSYRYSWSS